MQVTNALIHNGSFGKDKFGCEVAYMITATTDGSMYAGSFANGEELS